MEPRVLILAYGNLLRSDDGVAWHVADLLRKKLSSDEAKIVCVHQLMPELAEAMSRASGTIFIDARADGKPGEIFQARVFQRAECIYDTHVFTPAHLMALSNALYGNGSDVYEVSVSGESFTHGEELSDRLKSALPQMVGIVNGIVRQIQQKARM